MNLLNESRESHQMRGWLYISCQDQEGGGAGGSDPPENHKNREFLSNTGPDPLKYHKATKPAFIVGTSSARQRNAI